MKVLVSKEKIMTDIQLARPALCGDVVDHPYLVLFKRTRKIGVHWRFVPGEARWRLVRRLGGENIFIPSGFTYECYRELISHFGLQDYRRLVPIGQMSSFSPVRLLRIRRFLERKYPGLDPVHPSCRLEDRSRVSPAFCS